MLYVPRHWWHYVDSVDPVTVSVNSWIELDVDHVSRVSEAVTKTVVCALKSTPSDDNTDDWLNPTEEGVGSHTENMQYVNLALRASAQKQRRLHSSKHTQDLRDAVKRDSRGQIRTHWDKAGKSEPYMVPFGPNLIPVHCQTENLAGTEGLDMKPPRKTELTSSQNPSEEYEGPTDATVTTNDLLDCLLHPDVIALVTKLLLERHAGSHRTDSPL